MRTKVDCIGLAWISMWVRMCRFETEVNSSHYPRASFVIWTTIWMECKREREAHWMIKLFIYTDMLVIEKECMSCCMCASSVLHLSFICASFELHLCFIWASFRWRMYDEQCMMNNVWWTMYDVRWLRWHAIHFIHSITFLSVVSGRFDPVN